MNLLAAEMHPVAETIVRARNLRPSPARRSKGSARETRICLSRSPGRRDLPPSQMLLETAPAGDALSRDSHQAGRESPGERPLSKPASYWPFVASGSAEQLGAATSASGPRALRAGFSDCALHFFPSHRAPPPARPSRALAGGGLAARGPGQAPKCNGRARRGPAGPQIEKGTQSCAPSAYSVSPALPSTIARLNPSSCESIKLYRPVRRTPSGPPIG
jgi:hypothetical protein